MDLKEKRRRMVKKRIHEAVSSTVTKLWMDGVTCCDASRC
jgi:hypothetical protein